MILQRSALLVLALAVASAAIGADEFAFRREAFMPRDYFQIADDFLDEAEAAGEIGSDFTFVRIQYDTAWSIGSQYGTWATDYPAADLNFLRGVIRLTNIRAAREPIVLRLDDEEIFGHTFLYGLEMGRNGGIVLSDKEIENLRRFLLRGGFLFIDDFWGTYQWELFLTTFSKVFPDRKLRELDRDHPIFHSFYDIDGPQMIPAVYNRFNQPEEDIPDASNHVILDDEGRVMVLINWNSDIGDGWEHTYHPSYPTKYSKLAYMLGINFLVYALTH